MYYLGTVCSKCGKPYYYVGDVFEGMDPPCCMCNAMVPEAPGTPFSVAKIWTTASIDAVSEEKSSLRDEIERLGKSGRMVIVKYDPTRPMLKWTIVVGDKRIGDTDTPVKLLRKIE